MKKEEVTMEKISNWIEKKIYPLANKLARQKYLQA